MPKICQAEGCCSPVWGKGYCKKHQYLRTDKQQKRIATYSCKRKEENKIYDAESKEYRKQNPECAIKSPICTGRTQGVNHKKGRGKYLLDKSTWESACNPCNWYCEQNHQWAVDNGHKESRLAV